MASTNQDIGTSDDPYFAGDSLDIIVEVDEDGSDKDLTGASVEWAMASTPGGAEVLSQDTAGVSASVTTPATGEVTVSIDQDVTEDMAGSYYHELRVTSSPGEKSVVTRGTLTITERVNQ